MWSLAALVISLLAAAAAWDERMTRHFLGRVLWPRNELLPCHAIYRVSLVDITAKGEPVVVASTNRSLTEGGEGMPFRLSVHRKRTKPDHHYGFWAEIVAGDQVIYNSSLAQRTDLSETKALSLDVHPAANTAIVAPPSLHNVLPDFLSGTTWNVRSIAGGPVINEAGALLEIAPNGQLLGRVAGYPYVAEAAFEDGTIRVVGLTAGGYAAQLDMQEHQNRLFQSLFATTRFELEGRTLSFLNAEGQQVLTLEPIHTTDGDTMH